MMLEYCNRSSAQENRLELVKVLQGERNMKNEILTVGTSQHGMDARKDECVKTKKETREETVDQKLRSWIKEYEKQFGSEPSFFV